MLSARLAGGLGAADTVGAVLAASGDALGIGIAGLTAAGTALTGEAEVAVGVLCALQIGLAVGSALLAVGGADAQDADVASRGADALGAVEALLATACRADGANAEGAVRALVAVRVDLASLVAHAIRGVAAISLVAVAAVGVAAIVVDDALGSASGSALAAHAAGAHRSVAIGIYRALSSTVVTHAGVGNGEHNAHEEDLGDLHFGWLLAESRGQQGSQAADAIQ